MSSNEYMREYMKARRERRRAELLELLGGACSRCTSEDELHFDHIDSSTRSFTLSGAGLDRSWSAILEEAAKCQLLCETCHRTKTRQCGDNINQQLRECCGRTFVGNAYGGHRRWHLSEVADR